MTPRKYVRIEDVVRDVRKIAREHGYAVGVHGSLRRERDIDLIAAPWTRRAHAASTLRRAIAELPYLYHPWPQDDGGKPHGRKAWVYIILFRAKDCPAYIDLSVMPRG